MVKFIPLERIVLETDAPAFRVCSGGPCDVLQTAEVTFCLSLIKNGIAQEKYCRGKRFLIRLFYYLWFLKARLNIASHEYGAKDKMTSYR